MCIWAHGEVHWLWELLWFADDDTDDDGDDDDVCVVGRMVKYTGYGNCSGLLAQLGLLKMKEVYNKGDYSSDSEDSDTEEYSELKEK